EPVGPLIHGLRIVDEEPAVVLVAHAADDAAERLPPRRVLRRQPHRHRRLRQRPQVRPVPGFIHADDPRHSLLLRRTPSPTPPVKGREKILLPLPPREGGWGVRFSPLS